MRKTGSKGTVLRWAAAAILLTVLVVCGKMSTSAETYPRAARVASDGSNVYVRSDAGTTFSVVAALPDNTVVTLIGEKLASDGAKWYQIRFNHPTSGQEMTGYMHQTFLVYVDDSGLTPEEKVSFEELLSEFPASYQERILILHDMYPNWKFVAVKTGLDWETAVTAESSNNRSLVATGAISSWKSLEGDSFDWNTSTWKARDGANWVTASKEIVAYYMDPRNYLDGSLVFAFMTHEYDASNQTVDGVRSVIGSSFMSQDFVDANGATYSYASVIEEAGRTYGVSPYVLAAMIRIEIGYDGKSASISGTEPGYEGYFNYYNVGAYAINGMTANQRGLWYAAGEGANNTSYGRPWNSRYRALMGGAEFYSTNYVRGGQSTLYLKKFNVAPGSTYPTYDHQYMTNIQGAASEANVYSLAYNAATKQQELFFYIPVYDNMPEQPCVRPTKTGSPNNRLASITVNGAAIDGFDMNTLSYRLEVGADVQKITLGASAKDGTAKIAGTGELALKSGENVFTITVTAQNGDVRTYTVTVVRAVSSDAALGSLTVAEGTLKTEFSGDIYAYYMTLPAEATKLTVNAAAHDQQAQVVLSAVGADGQTAVDLNNLQAGNFTVVIKVTAADNVTVKEYRITVERMVNDPDVQVSSENYSLGDNEHGYVTGVKDFGSEGFSVDSFKANFAVTDGGSVSVVQADGMTPAEAIGTGTIVKIYNAEGQLCGEHTVVIYGDISGDGVIDALDLMMLRQYLKTKINLTGIYLEASNVSHEDTVSALDLMMVRQMLKNRWVIEQ